MKLMKAEQHVQRVEEEFWKIDFRQEDVERRRFIISLTETDDRDSNNNNVSVAFYLQCLEI